MERLGHIDISAATAVLMLAAALLASAGCQKTDSPAGNAAAARAELDIRLSVDGGTVVGGADTKSVVPGPTLNEKDRTYGIIACEHEDIPVEYKVYDADNANLYGNIQAWYGNYNSQGTGWWYSYASSADYRFKPLYYVTEDVSRHIDIYAYAPWKSGTTIQTGYQYDLTSVAQTDLPDLMYATYEDDGGLPTNRDIVIESGPAIPVNIHFHHALSRIVFHFKLATAQNTGMDGQHSLRLWQIDLERSSASETPLYIQGVMNLLTGEVTSIGLSQRKQTVTYATSHSATDALSTYDIYRDDDWKTFDMLVHPVEYRQDGDFSFRFFFNGNSTLNNPCVRNYEIKKSDLLHPGGTVCGFQPGYCYHFYFIIDNYIHLRNVVIADWTLTDETEIKI